VVPRIHGFQSTPGDSNVPSGLSQKNELPWVGFQAMVLGAVVGWGRQGLQGRESHFLGTVRSIPSHCVPCLLCGLWKPLHPLCSPIFFSHGGRQWWGGGLGPRYPGLCIVTGPPQLSLQCLQITALGSLPPPSVLWCFLSHPCSEQLFFPCALWRSELWPWL
jgi:hypothetical protein